MKAIITDIDDITSYITGEVGKYEFLAKLYDKRSKYGINSGRVSNLYMFDKEFKLRTGSAECLVMYEKGWYLEPPEYIIDEYKAVLELLENEY